MRVVFKNAKIITPLRIINDGGLIVEDNKIIKVFEGDTNCIGDKDEIIDVKGKYLSPGFIELHVHGGGNCDFMDATSEAIEKACKTHMRYGVTSIMPTTLASTTDELYMVFDKYREVKEFMSQGPNMIGLHLEGPYFSMEQRGAQDPKYIKNPDREEYLRILDSTDDIARWSLAPELEGALEMGTELRNRGILPSIAHSNATYEEVLKAYEHGFTHVTHLYSGMSTVRRINAYRYAGVVESAFLIDGMTVEIIADGKHLPESLLKLIYKIKGSDKICLITDATRAAAMPEGEYLLGSLKSGQRAIVEDGVAKMPDRSSFAGSVATADRLVRTMVNIAGVSIVEAVKMASYVPAGILGLENVTGSIAEGKFADLIVFDKGVNVEMVMTRGNICFNKLA